MRRLLVLLSFLFLSGNAHAGDFEPVAYGVHLASWHSDMAACTGGSAQRCNNTNPGIYVQTRGNWVTGGYYNSIERPTAYLGKVWPLHRGRIVSVDVATVAATGYAAAPVVPLVSPTASLHLSRSVALRVLYMPRLARWNETHVAHLSIEWTPRPRG